MLAKIAGYTEAHRPPTRLDDLKAMLRQAQRPVAAGLRADGIARRETSR